MIGPRRATRRRRPERAGTALALLTAVIVVTGCGAESDRAQPVEPAWSSTNAVFYLVRSGPTDDYVEGALLSKEFAPKDLTEAVHSALLGLLTLTPDEMGGPISELLPGLTSSVPPGIALLGVSIEDGLVTVDLGVELRATSGSSLQERTFAQQLAHTALLDSSLDAVRLLIDGAAVTELWGHLDWSEPLRADPAALSPITIDDPGPATVRSGDAQVTVRGRASVPGGKVLLRLEDETGTSVAAASVTASESAPGRGDWSWDVRYPSPGTWVIVAQVAEPSDGAGGAVFETRRTTAYER